MQISYEALRLTMMPPEPVVFPMVADRIGLVENPVAFMKFYRQLRETSARIQGVLSDGREAQSVDRTTRWLAPGFACVSRGRRSSGTRETPSGGSCGAQTVYFGSGEFYSRNRRRRRTGVVQRMGGSCGRLDGPFALVGMWLKQLAEHLNQTCR